MSALVRLSVLTFLIAALTIVASCGDDPKSTGTGPIERDINVALYTDRGTDGDCVRATEKMFQWMDCTVIKVTASYINGVGLDGFDILCVPGGDMYEYAQDLSSAGKQHIRSFISGGGGYIGICGGAYFAAERVVWRGTTLPMTPLRLFDGTARGVLDEVIPYPQYGMCQVNFENHTHPITAALPDTAWILYYWGPGLVPDETSTASILGVYELAGVPAIVALEHGDGRVFLTGPHPEFEEDSDRDGVSFADDLDDRGSDWDLMLRAVLWCLEEEMPQ